MPGVYFPWVEVEVWDEFNTALIAVIPRRWDVEGSDPLNVAGVGQVSVGFNDAILTRHPDLLNFRNWVKFYMGDGTGGGRYVGAFQIRRRRLMYIGTQEWGDQFYTVAGPMVHGLLFDFIVKHENLGVDGIPLKQDASNQRYYAWTAKPGAWYDAAEWADAILSHGKWNTHITNARSGTLAKPKYKPEDFPDKNAEWIQTVGNSTWQFFRRTLTVTEEGMIEFAITADEIVRLFLDGELIISRNETEFGYKSFSTYKTSLAAGEYTIAVMMRKKASPGGDGVDAFLFSCYTLDNKGEPGTVLARSREAFWKAHDGLPAPGWRQAEVLISQIEEAQTRGNRSANLLTIDFTEDLASDQSAGEDRDWTIEISKAMTTGTPVGNSQQVLSEIGEFDVWVDFNATPAQYKLKAAKRRGRDRSATVTLEPGRNLLGWEVEEWDDVANDADYQYDGGYGRYEAAASIAEHGSREVAISLGSVSDDETAATIASAHIERRKKARKRAGQSEQIERDEDAQPTAAVTGSPGNTPMLDWGTGDSIKVPSGTGVHAKQRDLGTGFKEDNLTGEITYSVTFGEED